jgi:hypothetical protein
LKTTELNIEQQIISEADELVRENRWPHRAFALSAIFAEAKIEGEEQKAILSFQLLEEEIDKIRADPRSDIHLDEKNIMETTKGFIHMDNNVRKSRGQKEGQQKRRQYRHPQTGESLEALLIEERTHVEGGRRKKGITHESGRDNWMTKEPNFIERLQLALFLTDLLTRIEREEEKEREKIMSN